MPEKAVVERAKRDKAQRKAPSTQAGEFVREEIEHVREGKHGARSTKQAIAIGLSKARRAGVDLPPPRPGTTSVATRHKAERDAAAGHVSGGRRATSRKRSQAVSNALKRESRTTTSREALSKQTHSAARRRGPSSRKASARKAARTRASSGH